MVSVDVGDRFHHNIWEKLLWEPWTGRSVNALLFAIKYMLYMFPRAIEC